MPLSVLRAEVGKPQSWCDAMVLHYNIKAATCQELGGQTVMTLYGGQKYYQLPLKENALTGIFKVQDDRSGHFRAELVAPKGPFGSSNHRIEVEAVELPGNRSLVGLRYSYDYTVLARRALEAYLKVESANRVGLTVIGRDASGRPQYVKGIRGAAERNGLRYYMALEAYLLNRDEPGESQIFRRLNCWYNLNEAYPRQLHDLSREEYLNIKLREYRNQVSLQRRLSPSA
ncbi:MAG: hypothetical protein BWY87_01314 [Deltaproteobacteria bacterium ADurb.Bin510]|nr:MAG: hypothetical protein BWY87_01314 [Deltaproteobacteria bacterium ADurb.Bin510]